MITTRLVNTEDEIASIKEKWNGLVETEGLDISNSYEWSMCLQKSHQNGKDLTVIVAENDSELVGVLPVFMKKRSVNLLPVRTIFPLGYLHSVHNDLVVRRNGLGVLDAFWAAINGDSKLGNWNVMEIPSVVADGTTDVMLRAYLGERKFRFKVLETTGSPYLELHGHSWDEYLKSRNAKVRSDFKSREKRIMEEMKGQIRFVTNHEEILRILECIENKTWKYVEGSAITNSAEQMSFYRLLVERYDANIKFMVLFLEEKPISYALCVLFGRKCYLLKTSYDEEYKKLSPGIVLLVNLLKYCFENNYVEFDFCGADEKYKLKFTDKIRVHRHYVIFNKSIYSELMYAISMARERFSPTR